MPMRLAGAHTTVFSFELWDRNTSNWNDSLMLGFSNTPKSHLQPTDLNVKMTKADERCHEKN